MSDFDDEVRKIKRNMAAKARQEKSNMLYHEIGFQAAVRGDNFESMPRFRRSERSGYWQCGFQAGVQQVVLQNAKPDKTGLKRMKDIIAEAIKAH